MSSLPSPDDILAFINSFTAEKGTAPTRRDLARAFKLKGPERAALRHALNAMEESGEIKLDGKRSRDAAQLPPVMVLDVRGTDDDGDLICEPATPPEGVHVPPLILETSVAAKARPPIGVGNRLLARLKPTDGAYLAVSPIKVLGKGASRQLGVFRAGHRGAYVDPVSRKQGDTLRIASADIGGASDGALVWAEPKRGRGHQAKSGRVVEVVGQIGESRNWSLIALAEQDIPVEFPDDVVAEADGAQMPDGSAHEDLTSLPFVTIDPADAKDHDDALYITEDDGGFTVFVAIADVSWFVRPDTVLDREARKRGNSVYLVDRVVPMLPEILSNGLCSLHEGEVRPSMVCEMRFTPDGRKTSHKFRRALIKCVASLSYEAAQAAADGQTDTQTKPLKAPVLDPLFRAYEAMQSARANSPSLALDMPERQIRLGDDGQVAAVTLKERFDAHKLVETMMVAANVCAAETLEQARRVVIYRVHDTPNDERLDALREYLTAQDYSLPKGQVLTPLAFNRILAKAAERNQLDLISMAILRSQSQAIYDTTNIGHFGLSLGRYAHFTSPIRRYADLTVHRGLVAALKLGPGGNTAREEDELDDIAEAISLSERRAIAAERSTADRFLAAYLEPQVGATFTARVSGMAGAGLFVALDETGADGFIPARTLGDDYFVHDEKTQSMVGRRTGGRYVMGQPVEVTLLEVTPVQGGLRFALETDPLPRAKRSGAKGKPDSKKSGKSAEKKTGKPNGKKPKKPSPKPKGKPAGAELADGTNAESSLRRRPRKKK